MSYMQFCSYQHMSLHIVLLFICVGIILSVILQILVVLVYLNFYADSNHVIQLNIYGPQVTTLVEKNLPYSTENVSPHATDSSPHVTENSLLHATENSSPHATENSSPHATENSSPHATKSTHSESFSTSQPTEASQSSQCTYDKNVTIYMDAFQKLIHNFNWPEYGDFLVQSRQCKSLPGGHRCIFNTDNKSSDAVLSYLALNDLKFKRVFDGQIVVLFTLEREGSPSYPLPPPDHYDIKVSYRRDSSIPVPYMCINNLALRLVEMGQPDVPVGRKQTASFISNCIKWRVDYVAEMMKIVHIDQWGACLKNTVGDFSKTRWSYHENSKLEFMEKHSYKYLISFENTVDDDYITEKVYHGYLTRTIPIYYGDKSVFDVVPGNHTLIYANDYTPKELAELMKRIDSNDTLYAQYFANWDLSKMRRLHEKYCSEFFMCAICRRVWKSLSEQKCGIKST